MDALKIVELSSAQAMPIIVARHYLHRRCNCWKAFGILHPEWGIVGVCIFGTPASRQMQTGACPSDPGAVIELNRLWCDDRMPRNTESWFVRGAMAMLPPRIILSYADTAAGHQGIIYRAAGFKYAGWTDMDRKTPRFDYIPETETTETLFGNQEFTPHTRDAFRSGERAQGVKTVRRKPKVRYWTVSGDRREKRRLQRICEWPDISWKTQPPPMEHGA